MALTAPRVVEHFDAIEIEDNLPHLIPGDVGAAADPFTFEQLKEPFSNGVVATVAAPAHAGPMLWFFKKDCQYDC